MLTLPVFSPLLINYGFLLLSSTFFLITGSMPSKKVLALFFNNGLCSNNIVAFGENL
jgi:hypothetical protein